MNVSFALSATCALLGALSLAHAQVTPSVRVIFDTDMETDCDDAGALAILHSLADLGECDILATVVSVRDPDSAATVDAINRYRGRADLPIGMVKGAGPLEKSRYASRIAAEFPHRVKSANDIPDSVTVYRDVLEKQPDRSVTIATVGYLTNLKYLLQLPAADGHPSGLDLIKAKVLKWVCMGGNFIGNPPKDDLKLGNVNFQRDAASAYEVIHHWPGEIIFAGREVCSVPSGLAIGRDLAATPADNPVRCAYEHYFGGGAKDRHVADLATVYYAVRGPTDCWDLSAPGRMDLHRDMTFEWRSADGGRQRHLLKKHVSGQPNDRHVEAALNPLLIQPRKLAHAPPQFPNGPPTLPASSSSLPRLELMRSSLALPFLLATSLRAADALPVVDLSQDTSRHVVIAHGTADVYQGHPTTLLLPDGRTMFCVWTRGHGGSCGPMKRSDDGGRTWSELLPVPENWSTTRNCPALYRLTDPQGVSRLFVFAGQGPGGTRQPDNGSMQSSFSTDEGRTWSPMKDVGLQCVMPFCTIASVDGGKRLIGLSNIRRPGETKDTKSNVVAQSESTDGGLTWSPWRILVDLGDLKPCEPEVIRSPDGKQLLCLMRENVRTEPAHFITSSDEGRTWSPVKPLPPGLHGDRHKAVYAPDGRLVICFRDTGSKSPTKNHFVAWVGRYEDITSGRDGALKVKLLHSHKGGDCGYPGLELLPDGTFVATTYVKYRPGPEQNSVVSTRFTLAEIDKAEKKTIEAAAPKVAGLLLDDDQAHYTGAWITAEKLTALVGASYRHHDRAKQAPATAKFTPHIPEAGKYEVRLLYTAASNRATATAITLRTADGVKTVSLNQQEACIEDGIPRSLGVFAFARGTEGAIEVSNAGADGYVVVDGLQLVPEAEAEAERNTRTGAGFSAQPHAGIPSKPVKIPPAMLLQSAAKPQDVDGRSYDLVVVGGTPGGIACAVRAAREGLTVLMVNHTQHLGGFVTSGAGGWEAPYDGLRSPLYGEMRTGAADYYRKTHGEGSPQHVASLPSATSRAHIDRPKIEPRIAELLFNQMVEREKTLAVLLGHVVARVDREGSLLKAVTLKPLRGEGSVTVSGKVFADGMYEGDLMAAAGVKTQIGREARSQYQEPHAGVIYTEERHKEPGQRGFPKAADEGTLNIRYNSHATAAIVEGPDSGEADNSVMAYNYRLILTRDPSNKIMVRKPANYDPAIAKAAGGGGFVPNLPNGKVAWNGGRLIGPQNAYPAADWPGRENISQQYLDAMLMRLWWTQNDPEAPEKERKQFHGYGLAADEFPDNGHVPYEIYVREARRLVGRYVFKEQDNKVDEAIARTPIHADSIAITDWPVDSVACLPRRTPGGNTDGILFLGEETRPAQVPYRSLLPQEIDNLLVPVPLSASHVGWGAIRLEPVWMQTGESAGFAAALAVRQKITPAALRPDDLISKLVNNHVMVSFFNDVDVAADEPWIAAAQFFGTKGFFHDYNARAADPLKAETAQLWTNGVKKLQAGTLDVRALARAVAAAEAGTSAPITRTGFAALLPSAKAIAKPESGESACTRAEALQILFQLVP